MKNQIRAGGNLAAVSVLMLLLFGGGLWLRSHFAVPELPAHATVLPVPRPIAEFVLSDQDGALFGRDSFRGHWSMLFFGFTNCPDICPVTLQQLAMARRHMAETDPDASLYDIVFVSVDPGRDTSAILSQFVKSFGDNVTGVSGEAVELSKLTSDLGIYFSVNPGDGENYTVEHSSAIIVINEDAEFAAVFSAPHDIDALANDMPLIMASQ